MPTARRLWNTLRRSVGRTLRGGLPVWHHPDYRLPITSLQPRTGIEPRRADLALWHLLDVGAVLPADARLPPQIRWAELARVHPPEFLETLTDADVLARIFAVEAWDIPVEQVLRTVRLACGATLAASREALERQGATLNLLGGFHHAGRQSAGGFCPVNDIAVAIAALREEAALHGPVVILDLDAHPPDGTADCLAGAPDTWIGSLSGADWGPLPPAVDETVLPADAGDDDYLAALEALLARMPARPALAYVLAGGDPWERDALGPLKVTEAGLRARDRQVAHALRGVPSVWLPGGGYGPEAWRPLAGTGLALALDDATPIPPGIDPLQRRYRSLSATLGRAELGGRDEDAWITEDDLAELVGTPATRAPRMLGLYTAQGVELALFRFGILGQLQRLGYRDLHIELSRTELGDQARLWGEAVGQRHLLYESVLERRTLEGAPEAGPVLFVHWLTLRHPLAAFNDARPPLPGQEVPGLGMAREAGEVLRRTAERLELPAVGLRPAFFHVAYASRYRFAFLTPERQGRFEALIRDAREFPLQQATAAISAGHVTLNGAPYTWEADEMAHWLRRTAPPEQPDWAERVAAAREATRFHLHPAP